MVNKYAPLIFINSNDSDGGKLFSSLHEMAHFRLGINSLFNGRYSFDKNTNKTEILCNALTIFRG